MLKLLEAITQHLKIKAGNDLSVAALKKATQPEKLLKQIDESSKAFKKVLKHPQ